MASSLLNKKNKALLLENIGIISKMQLNDRSSSDAMHLLHGESFLQLHLTEKKKAEGSEEEWKVLSEEIKRLRQERSLLEEKIIELCVSGHQSLSSDTSFYFIVNEETLLEALKKVCPTFTLIVEAIIVCENRLPIFRERWVPVSKDLRSILFLRFEGAWKSGNKGKLLSPGGKGCSQVDLFLRKPDTPRMRLKLKWKVSIEWETEEVNLPVKSTGAGVIAKVFSSDSTKDMTIVLGNGYEVKCHKIIFAAHSPVLAAMISPETGMKESKTGRVELPNLSEEGINYFLQYLYSLELSKEELSSDVAWELFQAADRYELKDLESKMENLFLEKGPEWFTADVLLELHFFLRNLVGNEKLKERVLKMMSSIPNEIKACQQFQKLNKKDALELFWTCWKKFCEKA